MMPGMPEKRTHDYVRHGTIDLFAAFDIATGLVIAKTYKCHRAKEWIKFLEEIDKQVPRLAEPDEPGRQPHILDIHIVADNYGSSRLTGIVPAVSHAGVSDVGARGPPGEQQHSANGAALAAGKRQRCCRSGSVYSSGAPALLYRGVAAACRGCMRS